MALQSYTLLSGIQLPGQAAGSRLRGSLRLASQRTLHWIGQATVHLYAQVALKMDVQWQAPLPEGAKIIVANHPTTLDPFLMLHITREPVNILVTGGGFMVPVLGRFLRQAGHVPVVRGDGLAALEKAQPLLDEGRTLVVFPESAPSPGVGSCHSPRIGAARLAPTAGVPIVPMGIHLQPERVRPMGAGLDGLAGSMGSVHPDRVADHGLRGTGPGREDGLGTGRGPGPGSGRAGRRRQLCPGPPGWQLGTTATGRPTQCQVGLATGAIPQAGGLAILSTRYLLTSLDVPTNLIAGSSGYSLRRFIVWDIVGRTIWLLLYGGLGYAFGSQWEMVSNVVREFGSWLAGAGVVARALYLPYRICRNRRSRIIHTPDLKVEGQRVEGGP